MFLQQLASPIGWVAPGGVDPSLTCACVAEQLTGAPLGGGTGSGTGCRGP